ILEVYLARTRVLADAAIVKLDRRFKRLQRTKQRSPKIRTERNLSGRPHARNGRPSATAITQHLLARLRLLCPAFPKRLENRSPPASIISGVISTSSVDGASVIP